MFGYKVMWENGYWSVFMADSILDAIRFATTEFKSIYQYESRIVEIKET